MCLIVLVYRKVEVDLYKQPRKDMMCLELDDQILLSITQRLTYSFVQYVRWLLLYLILCMLLYVNKCACFCQSSLWDAHDRTILKTTRICPLLPCLLTVTETPFSFGSPSLTCPLRFVYAVAMPTKRIAVFVVHIPEIIIGNSN